MATTSFSIYYFSNEIESEALANMRKDIHVARSIYVNKLLTIRDISGFLSNDGDLQSLAFLGIKNKINEYLQEVIAREEIHLLAVVDIDRNVIGAATAKNIALAKQNSFAENILLNRALDEEKSIYSTELVGAGKNAMISISAASPIFKKTSGRDVVAAILVRYILNGNTEFIEGIQQLLKLNAAVYHNGHAIAFKTKHAKPPSINKGTYDALMGPLLSYRKIDIRLGGQLAEYKTIYDIDKKPVAVLGISVSADKYVKTSRRGILDLVAIMLVCILIASLLGYLLARSILVPIKQLLNGVERISSGDMSQRITTDFKDELGVLANAFNGMSKQLNDFFKTLKSTVNTLTRVGTALSDEKNLDNLLDILVSEALSVSNADGGTLYTVEGDHLHFKIMQSKSQNLFKRDTSANIKAAIPLNRSESEISAYVALNKQLVCTPRDRQSSELVAVSKKYNSAAVHESETMLVVPLLDRMNNTIGVLQLMDPVDPISEKRTEFTDYQMAIVQALASQAAVAIENARNYEKIERKNIAFKRFVPMEFLHHLGKEEAEEIKLGDASQEYMSVLFADIRSFTELSEGMTPDDIFHFLNGYLEFIGPNITDNGGFIDKYIGDAIMALFPGARANSADDALAAAIGMMATLETFNAKRQKKSGSCPIAIGAGIHTGPLTLGIIGIESRVEGTVIGDTVNLASRIESLTKHYGIGIGITSATLNQLKNRDSLLIREVDTVQVLGRKEANTIYDIFNVDPEPLKERKIQTLDRYNEALVLYKQGQWKDALCLFDELHTKLVTDKAVKIYLRRCQKFKVNPPKSWDGVTRLDEK
ncbi:MAG: HAMP domain-containing protein [Gammaproteobacteria bacterium]|nr:HAMP domain-containing protein [Gammaproteobacteria bacterium]